MSKIVIFVAVLALACVNAQLGPAAFAAAGSPGILGGIGSWNPFAPLFSGDFKNLEPGKGSDYHVSEMSMSSGGGKRIIGRYDNDNGVIKQSVVTEKY